MPSFVRTQEIQHIIGSTGRLELSVSSADVQVHAVDGDEVRVRGTFQIRASNEEEANRIYDQIQLQVEASSHALHVRERDDRGGLASTLSRLLGGKSAELDVDVELPTGADLRLGTVSGDVQGRGLRGEQRYTTVSGDLYLTELGGSVRLNTVSGDASVRASVPLTVRAEAVSGDLSFSSPLLNALRSTSVSGDISLEGELAPHGEFRAETVSGDLSVGLLGSASFEVRGLSTDISSHIDHRIEGRLDRRRVVIGSGEPVFIFNSMSGDLSIRRPGRVQRWAGTRQEGTPPPQPSADEQLAILQALERGEIDVDEATRRLGGEGATDA